MKIRNDEPEGSLEEIYLITDTVPTTLTVYPENWTSERESAEHYIKFSLTQRKRYYLVPLVRTGAGEWEVAQADV